MSTIIEALKTYFDACALLKGGRLNVDWLPEDTSAAGTEYSIDPAPAAEVLTAYVGGAALCQYVFCIRSVADWGPDALQAAAHSGFFETLARWMDQMTQTRSLPKLPGGCTARRLEAQSTGYLMAADAGSGKYQVQCRLVYYRKGER